MLRLILAAFVGIILGFVFYAFAADITGSDAASIALAILGFFIGIFAALAVFGRAAGGERRVR